MVILMIIGFSTAIEANSTFLSDTTKVIVRKPTAAKMATFSKAKDYQYSTEELIETDTLWNRFVGVIINWFRSLFGKSDHQSFWTNSAYVFVAIVAVFVSLKLMGIDFVGIIRKKDTVEIPFFSYTENIHKINFQQDIDQATEQKNYRLAIRLYYLKALKELSDQSLIEWRINKTNQSYVYELQTTSLQHSFKQITQQFEYIWYGDFQVNEAIYVDIRNQFLAFSNQYNPL